MDRRKKSEGNVYLQSLQQLVGLPYIYLTHGFSLKNTETYRGKVLYSLPFDGAWTVVNGGVQKEFSHSYGILTQRYAYDFVMMDSDGKTRSGEKTALHAYYWYGKDILAPADGVVAETSEGCTDNIPPEEDVLDLAVEDIRGNYILIQHAEKEYSFIAHIQPGSIRVKKGQQVRRGERIAACGNTGLTSEPHIHFQIQDGLSFFSTMGLPLAFQGIDGAPQPNYKSYDDRTVCAGIEAINGTQYIGRGLRVENRP